MHPNREDASLAFSALSRYSSLVYGVTLYSDESERVATATATMWGVDFIDYDPDAIESLGREYGFAAQVGIFGHELGHIIDFHTRPGLYSSHERELRADGWAGCAIAAAGLDAAPMILALEYSLAITESETHPGWERRTDAVRDGWLRCQQ